MIDKPARYYLDQLKRMKGFKFAIVILLIMPFVTAEFINENTEITCNNGKCTATIYSEPQVYFENGITKSIEKTSSKQQCTYTGGYCVSNIYNLEVDNSFAYYIQKKDKEEHQFNLLLDSLIINSIKIIPSYKQVSLDDTEVIYNIDTDMYYHLRYLPKRTLSYIEIRTPKIFDKIKPNDKISVSFKLPKDYIYKQDKEGIIHVIDGKNEVFKLKDMIVFNHEWNEIEHIDFTLSGNYIYGNLNTTALLYYINYAQENFTLYIDPSTIVIEEGTFDNNIYVTNAIIFFETENPPNDISVGKACAWDGFFTQWAIYRGVMEFNISALPKYDAINITNLTLQITPFSSALRNPTKAYNVTFHSMENDHNYYGSSQADLSNFFTDEGNNSKLGNYNFSGNMNNKTSFVPLNKTNSISFLNLSLGNASRMFGVGLSNTYETPNCPYDNKSYNPVSFYSRSNGNDTFIPTLIIEYEYQAEGLSISFIDPTPNNNANKAGQIVINTTSTGTYQHSSFLDFNYTSVLWVNFENNFTGGIIYDNSTFNNNGNMTNFINNLSSNGSYGKALNFDGINDYVNFDNPSQYQIIGNLTISAMIYFDEDILQQNHFASFINKWGGTAGGGFFLGDDDLDSGKIQFSTSNGSKQDTVKSTTGITANQWHSLIGVWTTESKSIYIDGILNATSASLNDFIKVSINNLTLGGTSASYYFNGSLDEVHIFNRELSGEEIQALYNSSVNRLNSKFNLSEGSYKYQAWIIDTQGNINKTEQRTVNIGQGSSWEMAVMLSIYLIALSLTFYTTKPLKNGGVDEAL